ncbi:hypothetical protein ACOSQ2_005579 [Xanthoceras sorbifolium]
MMVWQWGLYLVIQDSEGDVMAAEAVSVGAKLLSLEAKALTILQRVKMALEFDSAMVVNLVQSRSVVLFGVDLYIEDIISKFDNLSFVDIIFIPRTANTVAHGLAKFTLQVSGNLFLMKDVSSIIAPLVSEDALFRL